MATDGIQHATILIVDDDPSTLLLASKPLQGHGYTVLRAPGSAEALRLYAEHPTPIQLVVTDIFLPPPRVPTFRREESLPPGQRSRVGRPPSREKTRDPYHPDVQHSRS